MVSSQVDTLAVFHGRVSWKNPTLSDRNGSVRWGPLLSEFEIDSLSICQEGRRVECVGSVIRR